MATPDQDRALRIDQLQKQINDLEKERDGKLQSLLQRREELRAEQADAVSMRERIFAQASAAMVSLIAVRERQAELLREHAHTAGQAFLNAYRVDAVLVVEAGCEAATNHMKERARAAKETFDKATEKLLSEWQTVEAQYAPNLKRLYTEANAEWDALVGATRRELAEIETAIGRITARAEEKLAPKRTSLARIQKRVSPVTALPAVTEVTEVTEEQAAPQESA